MRAFHSLDSVMHARISLSQFSDETRALFSRFSGETRAFHYLDSVMHARALFSRFSGEMRAFHSLDSVVKRSISLF